MGRILKQHLAELHESGAEVTEEALAVRYVEPLLDEMQTDGQFTELLWRVRGAIEWLANTARVVRVHRPSVDPMRPELRVLLPSSATAFVVRPPVRRQPG